MAAIRSVEGILAAWDPIAVTPGDLGPADEYASYAPRIVSMLAGGATLEDLTRHLEYVRTVTIGVRANRSADMACAQRLLAWWKVRS